MAKKKKIKAEEISADKIVSAADASSDVQDETPTALLEKADEVKPPELNNWVPDEEDRYFAYDGNVVRARFFDLLQKNIDGLDIFIIQKRHYKERMCDITQHINYFIKYYNPEKDFFMSIMHMKYLIDKNHDMTQDQFRNLILARVITPNFIHAMSKMANDLYTININTDKEGKYKSTPKITNEHAKMILALSFSIRAILPLCIHYSNINNSIIASKDYIKCFDKIFMKLVTKFEDVTGTPVFNPICRFVEYRLDRFHNADAAIWAKKQQLYGINYETEFQDLIHEVILVKALYKISYDRSVVSYIDGVVGNSYNHFRFENFKFKPVEIEADNGGSDNDDYLSHAESLEMSIYRIDESNQLINDANNRKVMKEIVKRFKIGPLDAEEFDFYTTHCKLNSLTQMLLHAFYSRFFQNTDAIYTLTLHDTITLLMIMKKYLLARGMVLLPQICTATVKGKFKENLIKNSKFVEKFEGSSVYQNIIRDKFKYIHDLNPKEDPIIKKLSTIINSTFEIVDYNDQINGKVIDEMPMDKIIDEFLVFLSII